MIADLYLGNELDLSVVIPVHNEKDCIGPLCAVLKDACDSLKMNYELVFVDDGSTDTTFKKLSKLHQEDPRIRIVRFRKNYGQTTARLRPWPPGLTMPEERLS